MEGTFLRAFKMFNRRFVSKSPTGRPPSSTLFKHTPFVLKRLQNWRQTRQDPPICEDYSIQKTQQCSKYLEYSNLKEDILQRAIHANSNHFRIKSTLKSVRQSLSKTIKNLPKTAHDTFYSERPYFYRTMQGNKENRQNKETQLSKHAWNRNRRRHWNEYPRETTVSIKSIVV